MNDSVMGVQDMFGNDVRSKDKPVKGYKYLGFTVLMIILLSIMVLLNSKSIEEIERDRLAEQTKNFYDELKRNSTKQQEQIEASKDSKDTKNDTDTQSKDDSGS